MSKSSFGSASLTDLRKPLPITVCSACSGNDEIDVEAQQNCRHYKPCTTKTCVYTSDSKFSVNKRHYRRCYKEIG